jgi:hypothetical protein
VSGGRGRGGREGLGGKGRGLVVSEGGGRRLLMEQMEGVGELKSSRGEQGGRRCRGLMGD